MGHEVSAAQVTGIHCIENFVVFGKCYRGHTVVAMAVAALSDSSGSLGTRASRGGAVAGGIHTLSCTCLYSRRGQLKTHT